VLDNDLPQFVDRFTLGLQYTYPITYHCYYGILLYFTDENIAALFGELSIVDNIIFNLGYMWTDVIMIVIGEEGHVVNGYWYYLMFYIGDFIFRFLFKEVTSGNCWYPWIDCSVSY